MAAWGGRIVVVSCSTILLEQRSFSFFADQDFGDMGVEQIVQPGSASAFFQSHVQATAKTMNKLENRAALVSRIASIRSLPEKSRTAIEIVA
jgi:hypothetical protein